MTSEAGSKRLIQLALRDAISSKLSLNSEIKRELDRKKRAGKNKNEIISEESLVTEEMAEVLRSIKNEKKTGQSTTQNENSFHIKNTSKMKYKKVAGKPHKYYCAKPQFEGIIEEEECSPKTSEVVNLDESTSKCSPLRISIIESKKNNETVQNVVNNSDGQNSFEFANGPFSNFFSSNNQLSNVNNAAVINNMQKNFHSPEVTSDFTTPPAAQYSNSSFVMPLPNMFEYNYCNQGENNIDCIIPPPYYPPHVSPNSQNIYFHNNQNFFQHNQQSLQSISNSCDKTQDHYQQTLSKTVNINDEKHYYRQNLASASKSCEKKYHQHSVPSTSNSYENTKHQYQQSSNSSNRKQHCQRQSLKRASKSCDKHSSLYNGSDSNRKYIEDLIDCLVGKKSPKQDKPKESSSLNLSININTPSSKSADDLAPVMSNLKISITKEQQEKEVATKTISVTEIGNPIQNEISSAVLCEVLKIHSIITTQ